jgi:hypothetical protein
VGAGVAEVVGCGVGVEAELLTVTLIVELPIEVVPLYA